MGHLGAGPYEQVKWAAPCPASFLIPDRKVAHERACIWLSEDPYSAPRKAVTLKPLSLTLGLFKRRDPRTHVGHLWEPEGAWEGRTARRQISPS